MALVQGTTFDDVYWTNVLKKVQEIIIGDFTYGHVYISPEIQHLDPFTIRIWGPGATTEALWSDKWHKTYQVDINLYSIDKNPSEAVYKRFLNDSERLYQLMFNNVNISGTLGWWNGEVENIIYNDLEGDEEEIDGLQKASLGFSCIVGRVG